MLMKMERIEQTDTGPTRLIYDHRGFVLATQTKSGAQHELPIDPASMDRLVAAWPAFKASIGVPAPAQSVAPATPSRNGSKVGPGPRNSPSSPPAPPPAPKGSLL